MFNSGTLVPRTFSNRFPSISPSDLFKTHSDLFKDMDKIFYLLFPDFVENEVPEIFKGYPVSNVYVNTEGEVKIEIAVTGFQKEEININIEDNCLIVSAERNNEENEEKWQNVYRNLKTSAFDKRYRLSNRMDIEKAKVTMENGILTIVIPIKEGSKPKKLSIK